MASSNPRQTIIALAGPARAAFAASLRLALLVAGRECDAVDIGAAGREVLAGLARDAKTVDAIRREAGPKLSALLLESTVAAFPATEVVIVSGTPTAAEKAWLVGRGAVSVYCEEAPGAARGVGGACRVCAFLPRPRYHCRGASVAVVDAVIAFADGHARTACGPAAVCGIAEHGWLAASRLDSPASPAAKLAQPRDGKASARPMQDSVDEFIAWWSRVDGAPARPMQELIDEFTAKWCSPPGWEPPRAGGASDADATFAPKRAKTAQT
jgi:hypothetical protein